MILATPDLSITSDWLADWSKTPLKVNDLAVRVWLKLDWAPDKALCPLGRTSGRSIICSWLSACTMVSSLRWISRSLNGRTLSVKYQPIDRSIKRPFYVLDCNRYSAYLTTTLIFPKSSTVLSLMPKSAREPNELGLEYVDALPNLHHLIHIQCVRESRSNLQCD